MKACQESAQSTMQSFMSSVGELNHAWSLAI
jgi:hypothetical protein